MSIEYVQSNSDIPAIVVDDVSPAIVEQLHHAGLRDVSADFGYLVDDNEEALIITKQQYDDLRATEALERQLKVEQWKEDVRRAQDGREACHEMPDQPSLGVLIELHRIFYPSIDSKLSR